jgi:hypothetical protein
MVLALMVVRCYEMPTFDTFLHLGQNLCRHRGGEARGVESVPFLVFNQILESVALEKYSKRTRRAGRIVRVIL